MQHYSVPYKTKQFFFVLVKLSIVAGAAYFIYNKLTQNSALHFSSFVQFTSKNGVFTLKNIFFLMLLSIFNWFLEILKWQSLVNPIQNINFKNALEQSLGALTASLFTPNRIGEYGAKAMYFKVPIRKHIMLVNLMGNMMQMGITVVLGCIGLVAVTSTYDIPINYLKIGKFGITVLTLIIIAIFVSTQSRLKIKGFSIKRISSFILAFPKKKLITGIILALARYVVFSFQLFFILQLLQVNLSYIEAMKGITTMYLIASVIPSIFIFDVIVKGSVAVYIFSFLGVNPLAVLCATTLMWLLNFAIPSCFGSFYVLNFKLPKTE
ncbi:lysylphosphatidylglycerol synthase domain-containing protein [Flavobacteriaceae bacterium MHTCC 0001]